MDRREIGFSSPSTVPMPRECTEMNIETVITGEVTVEGGDDMITTVTETGKGVTVTEVGAIAQVLTVAETEGHTSMMMRTEVGVDHAQVHPRVLGKPNMRGVALQIRDLLHLKVLMYEVVKEILSSLKMCPVDVLPIRMVHIHVVHRSSGKMSAQGRGSHFCSTNNLISPEVLLICVQILHCMRQLRWVFQFGIPSFGDFSGS